MNRIGNYLATTCLWLLVLLAPAARAQVVEYVHTDALGSPVAITNEAGQVIERSDYEPYGSMIQKTNNDRPGYTGHVMDSATGLTYMQQRYYDPTIGRFLSTDPVQANASTGASFNRYDYANNNPYRFTDPDGRQSCQTCNVPPTGVPLFDWLTTPSADRGSRGQMMVNQFRFELSRPISFKEFVQYAAIAMSAGTGAAGGTLRAGELAGVARSLSSAEGAATKISITSGATRASSMQIRVSMTAAEARANLADNGFKWKGSETTPGAGTMTNGNITYKFSPTSDSTGLPSATVVVDGKRTAKLRFDEK